MAVGYVTSAVKANQASVGSFNFDSSLGTGGRAGLVFVVTYANSGVPIDTGVTWNSVAMTPLYYGADTNTEPAAVRVYFLDNISNGTVTVSRTNNTVVTSAFAVVVSAASATIASQVRTAGGAGTINTNANTSEAGTAASGPIAVNDNSPGSNSMRFSVSFTGAATPLSADATSSTSIQTDDRTSFGTTLVRETTAGQGSRNVGVATGTTDDWAVAAIAVSEKINTNPQPGAASLTATGGTPTVVATDDRVALPTAASLTAAGATPVVATTDNVTSQPSAASLTLTGATPFVTTPVVTLPTAASLSLTGATPSILLETYSLPTAASLALAGATPSVATPVVAEPDVAALVLTGEVPAIFLPVASEPTAAGLTVTGAVPSVTVTSGADVVAVPTAASLALTGATPTVVATDNIAAVPTAASVVLTGAIPTVTTTAHVRAEPSAATLLLRGRRPIVAVSGAPQPPVPYRPPVPLRVWTWVQPLPAEPLHLAGAVPDVTIIDDGDFLRLLEFA